MRACPPSCCPSGRCRPSGRTRWGASREARRAARRAADAGLSAQLLPERQVQVFEADALGTKPGDKLHTSVAHFLAAVSQYAFLKNSECRLGIHNSGPYKVGGGEMLVREFVDLAESDLPWLDGVAENVELNNV